MQTNEVNTAHTKVVITEELRQQLGVPENEVFTLEKIGENQVKLKSLGIDENYKKEELPQILEQKLESIGIKKEYAYVMRTPVRDYTMIMLKLPKENAET